MQRTKLSHTDLEVSKVCMGTMTFGSQADLTESQRIIDRCLDAGLNFFDTANVYNQGLSEEIIGKTLGANRTDVILASKVRGLMREPSEYSGLSRDAIRRAIHDSLKRLATDYLDIYYLHQPDYEVPIEETLETLEELRREGKIRYPATSNYSAWQICEILSICEKNGYEPPWISQPMYNLLARGIEQEYLPFSRRFGVSNVSYNPLAGGLLTGKQKRDKGPLPGTRFDGNTMYLGRYWHGEYFEAVEALKDIATQAGTSPLQLALAWVMQQQDVQSVILGASKLEQLEENLKAIESSPLDPKILEACDGVWEKLHGPAPKYNR